MRIWLQKHTIEGRVPELDRSYQRLVELAAELGADLDIHTLPPEVYSDELPAGYVRFGAVEERFAWYFGQQAVAAEEQDYDVFLLTISQDPGLALARRLTRIPCVGYGETSLRLAQMYTSRVGVVGFIPELAVPILENFTRYGLGDTQVVFEYLNVGADVIARAFEGETEPFLEEFITAARRCIERGSEVIIPGEGLPNELLARSGVQSIDGAAVIDSDAAAVHMAVLLGRLAAAGTLVRPMRGYWNAAPPDGLDRHLRRALGQ